MGHGIDVETYRGASHVHDDRFRILTIGRISRTKGYGVLFDALEILKREGVLVRTCIIGGPLTEDDREYMSTLRSEVTQRGLNADVEWVGSVPHHAILPFFAKADLFVNMSETGSLDKAVLEAMASGVPVLTSNPGLESTLAPLHEECMFVAGDTHDFVEHIKVLIKMTEQEKNSLGNNLRDIVIQSHDIGILIPRIVNLFA